MRHALLSILTLLIMGAALSECEPRPISYQMLCQPHSSLDGVPFTLDLRLCTIVDRSECDWDCIDWQLDTVYCECVTTKQVEEWEAAQL